MILCVPLIYLHSKYLLFCFFVVVVHLGIPGHVVFANASRQIFNFRLDGSVPADSDIVLAEMKIYQDRANDVVFYHSLNHTHRHRLPTSARVSLHHVTNKDGVREASLADER